MPRITQHTRGFGNDWRGPEAGCVCPKFDLQSLNGDRIRQLGKLNEGLRSMRSGNDNDDLARSSLVLSEPYERLKEPQKLEVVKRHSSAPNTPNSHRADFQEPLPAPLILKGRGRAFELRLILWRDQ